MAPSAPRVRPDADCPFAAGLTALSYPERVEAILDGRIILPPHEPVRLSWPPDWSADPLGDTNWRFQLHALRWAQMLKRAYDHTGDPSLLERYLVILEDWYRRNPWSDPPSDQSWGDHSTALRARVYAACAQALEAAWPDWLRLALEEHVDVLSGPDLYPPGGNHALNQNIGLFAAASLLGRDDEVRIAIERTAELLGRSVDEEGVTDEQSTEYQLYNYRRYREAVDLFSSAGAELPTVFERIERMPEMVAHATLPNGHDAMVGDSVDRPLRPIPGTVAEFAATGGRKGPRPTDRVRVFRRGFVFARSGWGQDRPFDQETHLTIRFGPARIPHGHHDAGAVALYGRGRRIITNAGKYAYTWDGFRDYVLSRRAQNTVLLPEVPYSPDGGSTLLAADHDDEMLTVTIRDEHYPDVDLLRTIVFPFDGSGFVVADRFRHLDRVAIAAEQRLRLDPSFQPGLDGREVVADNGEVRVRIALLAGHDDVALIRGRTEPYDGWVSYRYGEREPATVVRTSLRGAEGLLVAAVHLAGTAAGPDDGPGWSVTAGGRLRSPSGRVIDLP